MLSLNYTHKNLFTQHDEILARLRFCASFYAQQKNLAITRGKALDFCRKTRILFYSKSLFLQIRMIHITPRSYKKQIKTIRRRGFVKRENFGYKNCVINYLSVEHV